MNAGVVVAHEAFGVTPHIEDVAARFAAEGYVTATPALFPEVFGYDTPFDEIRPVVGRLTGEGILATLDAAVDGLGVRRSRVAVVGFCMGGAVALYAGAMRELGAAVSFYGGGIMESRWPGVPPLVEVAPGLRSPWLGIYGGRDRGIPVEHVERLQEAAHLAPVPTRVDVYPDAAHGFFNDARPASHDATAAALAWPTVLSWLRMNLPQ